MLDQLHNLNVETCSDAELRALVRQIVPIVRTFIKASQKLFNDDNQPNNRLCDNCDKRNTCVQLCEKAQAKVPSEYKGKGYKEKTIGLRLEKFKDISTNRPYPHEEEKSIPNRDKLKIVKAMRLTDVYEEYNNCWYLLTDKQRQAITLRYKDGMTQKQIAEATGTKDSAVSALLKRAEAEKYKYDKKLRAERFNLLKNKNTE